VQLLRRLAYRRARAASRVDECARGADQKSLAAGVESRRQDAVEVASLRADSGHEERKLGVRAPQLGHLLRTRGTDHQHQIAVPVPASRRALRDPPVQRQPVDYEILKVVSPGIRRAAQENGAALGPRKKRQHGILAHVGIDRDRVGIVTLERLAGVRLGGIADVAALGVQDDQRRGSALADVADAGGELGLLAQRAVEGDLGFVGGAQVAGRIDDAAIEGEQRLIVAAQVVGKVSEVRIEAHADQAVGCRVRTVEPFGELERHCSMIARTLGVCLRLWVRPCRANLGADRDWCCSPPGGPPRGTRRRVR